MKTALQEHIEWLEDTLSMAQEHAPTLVNCLKLCISDAKLRMWEKEKQTIVDAYRSGKVNSFDVMNVGAVNITAEQYYEQTYEQ